MIDHFAANSDLLGFLIVTCIVSQITPGPNNLIVLTAGISDSRRAAVTAWIAVCVGFPIMVFAVSCLVFLFGDSIVTQLNFVKYLGIGFLVYLAIRLFLAAPLQTGDRRGKTPGFFAMVAFQWANPKALAMASSTAIIAGPELFYLPAAIFFLTGFPCVGVWLWFGDFLKSRVLGTSFETHLNRVLGILLAASVLMMI